MASVLDSVPERLLQAMGTAPPVETDAATPPPPTYAEARPPVDWLAVARIFAATAIVCYVALAVFRARRRRRRE